MYNNTTNCRFVFAVVVSNTARGLALFFTDQLRVDAGRRFLFAHAPRVRLHVRRHASPVVVDVGLVYAAGRHFALFVAPDRQRPNVRVSIQQKRATTGPPTDGQIK